MSAPCDPSLAEARRGNPRHTIGRPAAGSPIYEPYRPTALSVANEIFRIALGEGNFDLHIHDPPVMSLSMNALRSQLQISLCGSRNTFCAFPSFSFLYRVSHLGDSIAAFAAFSVTFPQSIMPPPRPAMGKLRLDSTMSAR